MSWTGTATHFTLSHSILPNPRPNSLHMPQPIPYELGIFYSIKRSMFPRKLSYYYFPMVYRIHFNFNSHTYFNSSCSCFLLEFQIHPIYKQSTSSQCSCSHITVWSRLSENPICCSLELKIFQNAKTLQAGNLFLWTFHSFWRPGKFYQQELSY